MRLQALFHSKSGINRVLVRQKFCITPAFHRKSTSIKSKIMLEKAPSHYPVCTGDHEFTKWIFYPKKQIKNHRIEGESVYTPIKTRDTTVRYFLHRQNI